MRDHFLSYLGEINGTFIFLSFVFFKKIKCDNNGKSPEVEVQEVNLLVHP